MPYKYDVFLSHNSKDKPAVEVIAKKLQQKYGLKCWLDKWNLVPGEPWQEALEEALDDCETVAVFVGPYAISPWENEEMRSALEARVHDKARRVIPVLLPGAPDSRDLKLPRFLTRLTWVDFRAGLGDEDGLYRLRCGIRGIKPGESPKQEDAAGGGLPPGSYLPFTRNALFTGREKELQSLAENLLKENSTNTVISQAVTGMGGIGKTQLAVEFAWRYGHRFKGVHWLDLRDPQALDSAIALCGTKMGYSQTDQRELIAATLQTWTAEGPRLLILDNFEEVAQANGVLVRFQHPSLRLLLTSRRRDFPKSAGLQAQQLNLFNEVESLSFLEKTLEQTETPTARKALAETLGYLPLALELAANYINISKVRIEAYLKELNDILQHESMQAEWFKELDVTNATDHDQSLFATFQISWREVKDETTQKIFVLAGYCAPNTPISPDIFRQTLELEDKALSKALYRLNALGLLPLTNDLPSIHPLLAAYTRTLSFSSEGLLEKLVDKLAVLAKQANDQIDQTGSLVWFAPLRPHILSAADFAEEADIQKAVHLLGNLGYYLQKIADYKGGKATYERALKIGEATYGSDHPEVAIIVSNLGSVLQALGDLAGAKVAYERALKIYESIYGTNHPAVATVTSNLGIALHGLGNLAGAKALLEHALKIDEDTYGADHPTVAIRVNNLGLLLQAQGDLAGAKAAFERALKIAEAVYGADHPTVAIRVNNLGGVLQDLGDLAGAKAAFERALKILKKFLPEGHPNIKIVQRNLELLSGQK